MAAFNKFNVFAEDEARGKHKLGAADDMLKVFLTNRQPLATDTVKDASMAEIAAGNGYIAGGLDVENDVSRAGAVTSVTGVDKTFGPAVGGDIGPFRYVVLHNDTHPSKPLVGWWEYPESITLHPGEPFLTDFGSSLFTKQ